MEETLRKNLLELARIYMIASPRTTLSAIGRLALNDNTFFSRLESREFGFNIRTHDRLVRWFSDNWPEGFVWPAEVPRLEQISAEPVEAAQ